MQRHILIPTDGSETAQRGIEYGLALAKDLGARVTILTATEPYAFSGLAVGAGWIPSQEEIDAFAEGQKEAADRILQKVKAKADELGVKSELVHVPDVRPAEAILQASAARDADLIVIGSHGRRGVNRLLLGSQAAEVLAHAAIPVLIVK